MAPVPDEEPSNAEIRSTVRRLGKIAAWIAGFLGAISLAFATWIASTAWSTYNTVQKIEFKVDAESEGRKAADQDLRQRIDQERDERSKSDAQQGSTMDRYWAYFTNQIDALWNRIRDNERKK